MKTNRIFDPTRRHDLRTLIGGSLLGIVGAILAVPTAAILQVLFEELVPNDV